MSDVGHERGPTMVEKARMRKAFTFCKQTSCHYYVPATVVGGAAGTGADLSGIDAAWEILRAQQAVMLNNQQQLQALHQALLNGNT